MRKAKATIELNIKKVKSDNTNVLKLIHKFTFKIQNATWVNYSSTRSSNYISRVYKNNA